MSHAALKIRINSNKITVVDELLTVINDGYKIPYIYNVVLQDKNADEVTVAIALVSLACHRLLTLVPVYSIPKMAIIWTYILYT